MSLRLRQIRLVAYQLEPVIEPVNGWRQTVSIRCAPHSLRMKWFGEDEMPLLKTQIQKLN